MSGTFVHKLLASSFFFLLELMHRIMGYILYDNKGFDSNMTTSLAVVQISSICCIFQT